MQAYKILDKIKESPKGQIFIVKKNNTDLEFTIKKYPFIPKIGISTVAIREVKALKKLNSPFVAGLSDIFAEEKALFLVSERSPFTLATLFSLKYQFNLDAFDSIIFQLFQATDFIHKHGMIHRNLNPENILLDHNCKLKLTGFDHSRAESDNMTNSVISLHYTAPEILLGDFKYTNKIDSWSLGCVIVQLKIGEPPFKGNDEISQCKLILKTLGSPDCEYPCNELFDIQQFVTNESLDQIIQKKFGGIFDEKILLVVKELFQVNKNKRLSVHNALKLSGVKRGEGIACEIKLK